MREQILRWIDVPTCIGIGPTKTLAKLANHIAKSAERKTGSYPALLAQVCNLAELSERQREWLYQRTPVGDVWGVGPRIGRQLQEACIATVLVFISTSPFRPQAPQYSRSITVPLRPCRAVTRCRSSTPRYTTCWDELLTVSA